ncbi:hypothetical protein LguiA_013844 [Lonicera macranthoides]
MDNQSRGRGRNPTLLRLWENFSRILPDSTFPLSFTKKFLRATSENSQTSDNNQNESENEKEKKKEEIKESSMVAKAIYGGGPEP